MTLTAEKLAELRALAEKAPAKWKSGIVWDDGAFPVGPYTRIEAVAKASAAFIGAIDPATVLALLDALEEARSDVADSEEVMILESALEVAREALDRVVGCLKRSWITTAADIAHDALSKLPPRKP